MATAASVGKLVPLADHVVVKIDDAEEITPGGIVIPDKAKQKPVRGTVVAVGPGKALDDGKMSAPAIKPGDVVLFQKYGGIEIEFCGEDLLIFRESDVLAVIRDA